MRRLACLAALLPALTLALAGCGEKEDALEPTGSKRVELMLDYFPNADHAGIYAAQGGYFEQAGIEWRFAAPDRPPSSRSRPGRSTWPLYEPRAAGRDLGVNVVEIGAIAERDLDNLSPEADPRSGDMRARRWAPRGRLPSLTCKRSGRCGLPANT